MFLLFSFTRLLVIKAFLVCEYTTKDESGTKEATQYNFINMRTFACSAILFVKIYFYY